MNRFVPNVTLSVQRYTFFSIVVPQLSEDGTPWGLLLLELAMGCFLLVGSGGSGGSGSGVELFRFGGGPNLFK